jgi:hypothetical protein
MNTLFRSRLLLVLSVLAPGILALQRLAAEIARVAFSTRNNMKDFVATSSGVILILMNNHTGASAQSTIQDLKAKAKRLVSPLANKDERLQEVAKFDHKVTGVTISEDGRIFANFPVGPKMSRFHSRK